MIGTLIELSAEQRLAVEAFQRTYGSVRVRRGPPSLPDSIVVEGFTRPRMKGRRRIIHAVVVAPERPGHVHRWVPSGSFDTGHQPPRQRYDCACGEQEWTSDPEGPTWA